MPSVVEFSWKARPQGALNPMVPLGSSFGPIRMPLGHYIRSSNPIPTDHPNAGFAPPGPLVQRAKRLAWLGALHQAHRKAANALCIRDCRFLLYAGQCIY